jgi:charged multivesicular body protein 2A
MSDSRTSNKAFAGRCANSSALGCASRTRRRREERDQAADGETESVMILCRDLIRNRSVIQRFLKLRSQLEALGLRIEITRAQSGAAQAMKGAAGVMHQLNAMVNVPEVQMVMQKFMMENEMMDMKVDMVDEARDLVTDPEATIEDDAIAQYQQLFAEMGIPPPPEFAVQIAGRPQPV